MALMKTSNPTLNYQSLSCRSDGIWRSDDIGRDHQ